eukprot:TRINITY_DN68350_c0_g1_i1.p1 TRINITY_DN68350_c0_g1~~TRINITY_DN68350_c0_g1_i1.p1  ORF type:complete len:390 (-),score=60.15 TRINITY_DN68350_c0_g1_i1:167-1336(-)
MTIGPRVLIVNPSAQEALGLLGESLAEASSCIHEFATSEVVADLVSPQPSPGLVAVPALPRTSDNYDCLIVLGAPLGICDPLCMPGLLEQICTLALCFHEDGKPVLALGLGACMVAGSLGGGVTRRRPLTTAQHEDTVGRWPVVERDGDDVAPMEAEGESDPAGLEFAWMSQDFLSQAWSDRAVGSALKAMVSSGSLRSGRLDTSFGQRRCDGPVGVTGLEPPPGAQILSYSAELVQGGLFCDWAESGRVEAFRLGCGTYAFRFHIEASRDLADRWYADYSCGRNARVDEGGWQPADAGRCQAVRMDLDSRVAEGALRRSEAFGKTFVRCWLLLAEAARAARTPEQHGLGQRGRKCLGGDGEEEGRSRSRSRSLSLGDHDEDPVLHMEA